MYGTIVVLAEEAGMYAGRVEGLGGFESFDFVLPRHEGSQDFAVGTLIEFAVKPMAVGIQLARTEQGDRMRGNL